MPWCVLNNTMLTMNHFLLQMIGSYIMAKQNNNKMRLAGFFFIDEG
jgi:hypothetical protein